MSDDKFDTSFMTVEQQEALAEARRRIAFSGPFRVKETPKPTRTPRSQRILNIVDDLVSNFLYYDRKEDEDLPRGGIEDAVRAGEISVYQIIDAFTDALHKALDGHAPSQEYHCGDPDCCGGGVNR